MELYQSHISKHQKQLALFAIPRGLTMTEETPLQPSRETGMDGLDPTTQEVGTLNNEDLTSLNKDQKESVASSTSGPDEQSGTSMRTSDYFSIGKRARSGGHTQSAWESFAGSSSNPGRQRGGVSQWQCCNCGCGWHNVNLNASCPVCQVRQCSGCIYCWSLVPITRKGAEPKDNICPSTQSLRGQYGNDKS